jgi:putative transferase (TIGR04331 family)
MVKKLLVTTALENTWDFKKEIIFLGEWCKLYERKHVWEKLNFELLPYHWDDRELFFEDYKNIIQIYERVLIDLSKELNVRHSVQHDIQYWRILIGPWLGYFTGILFDRWLMIDELSEKKDLTTIILKGMEEDFIPNDMPTFLNIFIGDEWNHFIFGNIIKKYPSIHIVETERNERPGFIINQNKLTKKQRIKRTIALLYSKISNILTGERGVLFITTHLQIRNLLKLFWLFKQLPNLPNFETPRQIKPNFEQRNWTISGRSLSLFESILREMIPQQIPVCYLEGYKDLVSKSKNMNWPVKPYIIFTSNSFSSDDIFKAYAAEHRKNGTPFVIGQHGGHYGCGKWSMSEEHEITASDKYLSWGWTDSSNPKVKSVGQIKSLRYMGDTFNHKKGILLVTSTAPRYSYLLFSAIVAGQWLEYLKNQFDFVQLLSGNIQNHLIVRLFKSDFELSQLARWKEKFPRIKYDNGTTKMAKHMRSCRIFVSTYNATTYLESISINIPTVIFWDPLYWEIRDSAIPLFEELKSVKIFHDTPESAAEHINKIWDNVDAWWSSQPVRNAVDRLKIQYCNTSPGLIERIESELRNVSLDGISI